MLNIDNLKVEYIKPPNVSELKISDSWVDDNCNITARLVNERDIYYLIEGNNRYLLMDDRSNVIYYGGYDNYNEENERFSLLSPTQKIVYLINKSKLFK